MAFICHVVIRKLGMPTIEFMRGEAEKINVKKLLVLYILSTVFLTSIGFIFGNTSGFAQILVSIADFKWIFLLWYGYVIWIRKKNRIYLFYIGLYEFTSGFYSYFSSFKEVIFYIIILALTFIVQIKFKQFLQGFLVVAFLVPLFISWNVIKGDYRNYLNQGSRQQTVAVSREEAYARIWKQFQTLKWEQYEVATSVGLYRLQYVLHFALAMERVPAFIPYENGNVWMENATNAFMPRLLFPSKAIYDPSKKASKFTGKNFAGQEQGAAFSLGYFADSYVDFGPVGMFIPLILLGLFVAYIYKVFFRFRTLNLFLRFAIINVVLHVFIFFESDGLFLFGRLMIELITFYVLGKYGFPKLQRWIEK